MISTIDPITKRVKLDLTLQEFMLIMFFCDTETNFKDPIQGSKNFIDTVKHIEHTLIETVKYAANNYREDVVNAKLF